jgi:hypothetical protein
VFLVEIRMGEEVIEVVAIRISGEVVMRYPSPYGVHGCGTPMLIWVSQSSGLCRMGFFPCGRFSSGFFF